MNRILITLGADRTPAYVEAVQSAREAVKKDMPGLAICRGIQVLNVALGGTLIYDVPTQFGTKVDHSPKEVEKRIELSHETTWRRDARLVRELGHDYPRVNSS